MKISVEVVAKLERNSTESDLYTLPGVGAPEAAPRASFLAFIPYFRSFFRLITPMNLK